MSNAKRKKPILKVGDLVVNTGPFPLSFLGLKTYMMPNELGIIVEVDISSWVKVLTESGYDGWYLNFAGYLQILTEDYLTSPYYCDIL